MMSDDSFLSSNSNELNDINLDKKIKLLKYKVKEKEIKLEKLKLVKKYEDEESDDGLIAQINCWSEVCENALQDLFLKLQERENCATTSNEHFNNLSKSNLLKHLLIDPKIVHVNDQLDAFEVLINKDGLFE